MKPDYYTREQLIETLYDLVTKHGSQKAVAELLNMKPAYLSDVLHSNREISHKVAEKIGFYRKTVFEKIDR